MTGLTIENLSFAYEDRPDEPVFERLNLRVKPGEFLSILGPSGCGKSTLLNILSGILPGYDGRVLVGGEAVRGISSHFASMPQDDLLMPYRNILDNVCLYGTLHGKAKEYREKALRIIDIFGLAGYEYEYPAKLSGGMRQRAAFLRTALCPAEIMLLDEPFGALDVITRGDMQDWLLSVRKELDRTTILVTHDMDEALRLSDRVIVLKGRPAVFAGSFHPVGSAEDSKGRLAESALREELYDCLR
ncbi:MAG: ATP-binding cassette domain-containing protein [Clostridiales Family XIII bacterium]|jgi:ABC-type nitrate/sulfonate/bicarbonate transport system ATPase subunit|nr:ATP-binding cassette domain-containing protein [Clostridiales Family XIII bacterium]